MFFLTFAIALLAIADDQFKSTLIDQKICGLANQSNVSRDLVDLTLPGQRLHGLPLTDQGEHGTCYAHAASVMLSSLLSDEERRKGGCSVLEVVSYAATNRHRFGSNASADTNVYSRRGINGGNSQAIQPIVDRAECCLSQAVDQKMGNAIYKQLEAYSSYLDDFKDTDEEYKNITANIDNLVLDYIQKIGLDPSIIEGDEARLVLTRLYKQWANSKENTPQQDKAYQDFDYYLRGYLEAKNGNYQSLSKQRDEHLKRKIFERSWNDAHDINGLFTPGGCQYGAEQFKDITEMISATTSAMVTNEIEPYTVVRGVTAKYCQGNRAKLNHAQRYSKRVTVDTNVLSAQIRSTLVRDKSPIQISFCANLLASKTVADANSFTTQMSQKLNDSKLSWKQFSAECGRHEVVLAGARYKNGVCQLRLRNSWGDLCSSKSIFDCTDGDQWIPASLVVKTAFEYGVME